MNRKIQVAFGVAILTLLVVGAISYRSMVASSESERWVLHTHEVVESLQDLLFAMENVDSSCRAFVLTGKESRLEAYSAGIVSSQRHEADVRSLTMDNSEQQRQIPVLQRLAAQQILFSEKAIRLRREKGFEAAESAITGGQGQLVMDEFEGIIRQMQREELRLLVLRNANATQTAGQSKGSLICGVFLGLLITVAAAWSVQHDSSRRAFAEEALRGSEERYRRLLEAAPDAMVIADAQGRIVLVNAETERMFGYSRDELYGQHVELLLPERSREGSPRTSVMGEGRELRGLRKDGSEFPAEIGLSPVETPEGTLVTSAIRDVSVRKRSEEHLMRTVAELKRSNDELQRFAYVSSHDLQEPLRMVTSYMQLLAKRYKGQLDSDADVFIGYAVDGCNRMKVLIQDLLTYSRVGTTGSAPGDVSGEEALQDALTNLLITIEQSGAVVTHDVLPTIRADKTQLSQVLQNLIANAIKYRSAEVPHVHVAAQNGDNEWIFSVSDNGMGIDPQYFERIFVLFQRLHGQGEFSGTGIGLAICKKIVERRGGRIWVESQPEEGSTFYFTVPQGEDSAIDSRPTAIEVRLVEVGPASVYPPQHSLNSFKTRSMRRAMMMGRVCECANKRRITLTLGPETTSGEQKVPCPLCKRPLLSSLGGRVIRKVTIDHPEGAEGWLVVDPTTP
jgi:PAS domain S-box-containing protein